MTAAEVTALRFRAYECLTVMATVLTDKQLRSSEVEAVEDLVAELLDIIEKESK